MIKGKVWKYERENINTDEIIPARFLNTSVTSELAKHCMEDIDAAFVTKVKAGDIIVAGRNFGCGSSREHAPISIKACGVSCVIAPSFARIFFRNAVNIGLPIIESDEAYSSAAEGDLLEIELNRGLIKNLTKNREYVFKPFPEFMRDIFETGGLMEFLKAGKF